MSSSHSIGGVAARLAVVVWPAPESSPDPVDGCIEELGDCSNPLVPSAGDIPLSTIAVAVVMLGVLSFGLRAIKRQRADGRRRKLPPIG